MSNMSSVPPLTPTDESGFDPAWVAAVALTHLASLEEEEGLANVEPEQIRILRVVRAERNEVQGILSTTYVVHFEYCIEGREEQVKEQSLFVKVPLRGKFN